MKPYLVVLVAEEVFSGAAVGLRGVNSRRDRFVPVLKQLSGRGPCARLNDD